MDWKLDELISVLARIALAEHEDNCNNKYCPINECVCYNPVCWASKVLGVKVPYERDEEDDAELRTLIKGNNS